MRISDWSSDVCSSDLPDLPPRPEPWCGDQARPCAWRNRAHRPALRPSGYERGRIPTDSLDDWPAQSQSHRNARRTRRLRRIEAEIGRATSELQSLMRISYAVFCLKKKITHEKYLHRTT